MTKEEIKTRGKLKIIACKSGEFFAKKVLAKIDEKEIYRGSLIDSEEIQFANSEIKTVINESIRDADVYVFQDVANSVTGFSIDENLRALKTAIDAAWRSDAKFVTAVIPTFPYARQDKANCREGITAAAIAREIEGSQVDNVITLDVHNTAIAGFFRRAKFENLFAAKNIIDYIKKKGDKFGLNNLVVMPPDLGRGILAENYAQRLGAEIAFVYKKRNYKIANTVESSEIVGDVEGKNVLIVDDMIDTGGTLVKAMEAIKIKGAKKIFAACSLPFFNKPALERMEQAYKTGVMDGIIGTDAVYHGENFKKRCEWFTEVSVASYFAKVISCMNKRMSISELLKEY